MKIKIIKFIYYEVTDRVRYFAALVLVSATLIPYVPMPIEGVAGTISNACPTIALWAASTFLVAGVIDRILSVAVAIMRDREELARLRRGDN